MEFIEFPKGLYHLESGEELTVADAGSEAVARGAGYGDYRDHLAKKGAEKDALPTEIASMNQKELAAYIKAEFGLYWPKIGFPKLQEKAVELLRVRAEGDAA